MTPEIWPPLLTPFTDRGALDLDGLNHVVEHFITQDVDGFLVNGLSAEPFKLTEEERHIVLDTVIRVADGKIGIAAAVFPDHDDDWQRVIAEAHEAGADCAVLLAPLLVPEDADDTAVCDKLQAILRDTSGNLGLYEAPRPYKRRLGPAALQLAAESGRFTFLKDTCEDLDLIARRLSIVAGSPLKLLNAQAASFRDSVGLGAAGFCGLMANVFPREMRQAALADAAFLSDIAAVADCSLEKDYPSSAKLLLREVHGLPISSYSRTLGRGTERARCAGLFAADRLMRPDRGAETI